MCSVDKGKAWLCLVPRPCLQGAFTYRGDAFSAHFCRHCTSNTLPFFNLHGQDKQCSRSLSSYVDYHSTSLVPTLTAATNYSPTDWASCCLLCPACCLGGMVIPTNPMSTYHPPKTMRTTDIRLTYCTFCSTMSKATAMGTCKDIPSVADVGPANMWETLMLQCSCRSLNPCKTMFLCCGSNATFLVRKCSTETNVLLMLEW